MIRRVRLLSESMVTLLVSVCSAHAHEAGAPFSGAIIDPIALHHAHIESEQRLNLFALRSVQGFANPKRNAFQSEFELAWSNDKFNFGAEAFVTFQNIPSPDGQGRQIGIGDMEIRPIKWAFVNRPDFVISTATGIGLPTGNQERGLGNGNTTLTQYLFLDKAFGNWYLGLNFAADTRLKGESGSGVEYGAVVSYSFINGAATSGLADPFPQQSLVISPSLELISSKRLSGLDSAEKSTSLLPGLTLWWPQSGWQLHAGVNIPQSGNREADRIYVLQIGNHFNWEDLFGGGTHH